MRENTRLDTHQRMELLTSRNNYLTQEIKSMEVEISAITQEISLLLHLEQLYMEVPFDNIDAERTMFLREKHTTKDICSTKNIHIDTRPVTKRIETLLKTGPSSVQELACTLKCSTNQVHSAINSLMKRNAVEKVRTGVYKLPDKECS